MNTKERISALENEIQMTNEELKPILLDIRSLLAEAKSPLRRKLNGGNNHCDTDSGKVEEQHGN